VPFETVALRGNTTVNIDTTAPPGSDGIDAVTITSADNAHGNTNLKLTTGSGAGDMLEINGGLSFVGGTVNLSSQRIDFNNLTSVISAATVALSSGSGPITDGSPGTPSVIATTLTSTAGTSLSLGTNVGSLSASTLSAGAINIVEANDVVLTSVISANGPIAISTGGATTVTSVVSSTDVDANDISITASSGDISVVTVTAGAGADADVSLQASAGSIFDDSVNATVVKADVLSLTASRSIGQPGAIGQIDSTAKSLVAATTGAGPFSGSPTPGIWVTDTDALAITSATTVDGIIFIDAAAGLLTAALVQAGGTGRMARLDALGGDFSGASVKSLGGNATIQATGKRISACRITSPGGGYGDAYQPGGRLRL